MAAQVFAILGSISGQMLVRVALAEGCGSYDAIVSRVLGPRWLRVFQVFMVLSSIGSLTAYLMLSADFVESLATIMGTTAGNRRIVIVVLSFGVMLPLALLRTLSSLVQLSYQCKLDGVRVDDRA